jgi:hypothetical protein
MPMAGRLFMSRHRMEVIERDHVRVTPSGRVVMRGGEPVLDGGPAVQAIAPPLWAQERKARLMGLDERTQRAVDVVTDDMVMAPVAELEADVAHARVSAAGTCAHRAAYNSMIGIAQFTRRRTSSHARTTDCLDVSSCVQNSRACREP